MRLHLGHQGGCSRNISEAVRSSNLGVAGRPIACPYLRSNSRPKAWNVPDHTAVARGPTARRSRAARSCAERLEYEWDERTTHYYLTSSTGAADEMAGFVRGHWGIENGLHWVLDVVFREDDSRVRAGHAGENLAMVRRVAVSLLRRAPGKGTTPTKRLKAGWDDDYLLQVLQGIPALEVR